RGGREEDLQADRRARGQRRRAERLRQLRRQRRDHGEGRRVASAGTTRYGRGRRQAAGGRHHGPTGRDPVGPLPCPGLSVAADSLHGRTTAREGGACAYWGWTRG